jgi:hypothetical protein
MKICTPKPNLFFCPKYYYFHKTWMLSMMVHVVVHVRRRLINMYVGLIGSVNDFWVLWELGLYNQTQEEGLLIWKKVIKKVSIHLFLVTRLSIVDLDNDTSQGGSTFFSWVVLQ